MSPDQCQERATACAANARIAVDELVSQEFLKLAAQWRAMAVRTIVLGGGKEAAAPTSGVAAPVLGLNDATPAISE